jgi:hypothetical protein
MPSEITPVFLNELYRQRKKFTVVQNRSAESSSLESSFYLAGVSLIIPNRGSEIMPGYYIPSDPLISRNFKEFYSRTIGGLQAQREHYFTSEEQGLLITNTFNALGEAKKELRKKGYRLIGGYALYGSGDNSDSYFDEVFAAKAFSQAVQRSNELQEVIGSREEDSPAKQAAFILAQLMPRPEKLTAALHADM